MEEQTTMAYQLHLCQRLIVSDLISKMNQTTVIMTAGAW